MSTSNLTSNIRSFLSQRKIAILSVLALVCASVELFLYMTIVQSGPSSEHVLTNELDGSHIDKGFDADIRFMTYNIRLDTSEDGEHAWPHRKHLFEGMIRLYSPDLLHFQEVLPSQLLDLKQMLPQYDSVYIGRNGDFSSEMVPVFFRRTRFSLEDYGWFWLSETPSQRSIGWDARHERVVTWVRLKDRLNGRHVRSFNLHFDHIGAVARLQSAKLVLSRLQQAQADGDNVLISGDLNALESDPCIFLLKEGTESPQSTEPMLIDSKEAAVLPHLGPEMTWSEGFLESVPPTMRLDYVMVSKRAFRVELDLVATNSWNGKYASDHLPWIVLLSWRSNE